LKFSAYTASGPSALAHGIKALRCWQNLLICPSSDADGTDDLTSFH
jgi:hypothetical protein